MSLACECLQHISLTCTLTVAYLDSVYICQHQLPMKTCLAERSTYRHPSNTGNRIRHTAALYIKRAYMHRARLSCSMQLVMTNYRIGPHRTTSDHIGSHRTKSD